MIKTGNANWDFRIKLVERTDKPASIARPACARASMGFVRFDSSVAVGEFIGEVIGERGDRQCRIDADAAWHGRAIDDEKARMSEDFAIAIDHARFWRIAEAATTQQMETETFTEGYISI